ncbi:MAG: hypothetical protein ABJ354_14075, partial [Nitratireductor sp.]
KGTDASREARSAASARSKALRSTVSSFPVRLRVFHRRKEALRANSPAPVASPFAAKPFVAELHR